ncbi:MAG: Bacterial type II secretion system protein G [Candidatus Hydrogenedentes bacterium ADurb.Bin101]|nr:MAG: Bacterial type II secretion system protein G [Candidatus Hydrogenedentes bacterium ADurb.Bin101]
MLIVQLVRCACVGIIFDTTREVLAQVAFDDSQLAWLQQWFSDVHIPDEFYYALIGERVFGIMAFENPAMLATADEDWAKEEYAVPIVSAASALGLYNREWDHYFSAMEELIAGIRLPYPEAQAVCDRLVDRRLIRNPPERSRRRRHHRPPLPELSKGLYGFTRLPQAKARDQARASLGATAMALGRYRLAEGQFPETLQALVPEYLAAVPEDPIDLQPLRYRRDEEGYVVYSIGTNGVDDGGLASDVINEGDLTFILRQRLD